MLSCRSLHHLTSAGALCPAQICAPGVPRLPPTPGPPPRIPALLRAWPSPQLHPSRPNSGVTLHPRSMLGEGLVSPQQAGGDQGHIVEDRGPCPQARAWPGQAGEGRGLGNLLSPGHHAGQPVHGSPRRLSLCRAPCCVGFPPLRFPSRSSPGPGPATAPVQESLSLVLVLLSRKPGPVFDLGFQT